MTPLETLRVLKALQTQILAAEALLRGLGPVQTVSAERGYDDLGDVFDDELLKAARDAQTLVETLRTTIMLAQGRLEEHG